MDGSFIRLRHRHIPAPIDRVVVAIPARDEARRMARLLDALSVAAARCHLPVTALVLANNCRDRTATIADACSSLSMPVRVYETSFPGNFVSAGRARRAAMELAACEGALLMTTDADAVPDPGWIAAALHVIDAGADLVCGTISARVDHVQATASGARITRAESAYGALVHEIRHCIDRMAGRQSVAGPRPHYMESGASLAIRVDTWRLIGGMPAVDAGEDRALVHRAERHGLTVRYVDDMRTRVSARLHGRARGGMAECLRLRMCDGDPPADQAMLPLAMLHHLWRRAMIGHADAYPDRGRIWGMRLRASDLERDLPELERFVASTIRPDFARWMQAARLRAVS